MTLNEPTPSANATRPAWKVRPLAPGDRSAWEPLWRGYQQFYKVDIAPEVTTLTWERFHDPAEPMQAFGAFDPATDKLVGIVHCILHRSSWTAGPYCYLQDLFTSPEVRGLGVGRVLIEAVYAWAREQQASRVWWLTHESNQPGRLLYDQVADQPGFIQYRKVLG